MDLAAKVAGLAVVFGLLALWAWMMRRAGARIQLPLGRKRAAGAAPLRSEAALILSPHHRLHLIQWEEKRFLVLTSPAGGSVLDLNPHTSFLPAFAEALGTAQDISKEQA